jgi:phospholipase C
VTGDLTSAFNFAAKPNSARPRLAAVKGDGTCPAGYNPVEVPSQPMPKQARGKRKRPSGIVRAR